MWGYNNLTDLDIKDGTHFYHKMEGKVQAVLDSPSHVLSREQKEYWGSMADNVDTPLQYGYYGGWEIIINSFELLMFALLAVCIVVAPVFSGEYQAGMAVFILHIFVACGLPLAAFGIDGYDLPVQIANTAIPYPFTFLQAVLINIGIIYLVLLAMIGLTLLLSAKMKSPYFVLIILVPVLFIPMFLIPNKTTGAYNLTLFLLPPYYYPTVYEVKIIE